LLIHPIPYYPLNSNSIKLGTSKVNVLANGVSLSGGYQFRLKNVYMLATEFDIGAFSDSDGDLTYQGLKHFVSASYYMALKQKFGYFVKPNLMLYGMLGLSQNSIGDRVYTTVQYFNKKQVSVLFGGGVEYYVKRYPNIALFGEYFYFTPTGMTTYSGGARPPTAYSLSANGGVLELGLRYYFN
jgi:hypothetical protein